MALVGLYVRLSLEESLLFRRLVENREVASAPIANLFREHKREVALTFAISSFSGLAFYIIGTYFNSYLSEVLGLDATIALLSTGLTLFLTSVVIVLSGVDDRVGRKPVLYTGAAWLALLSVPAFYLAGSADSLATALVAQLLLVPGLGMFVAGLIVILVEMFPTKVRYSGGALGYNVGYALFGGTGPFVSAFLIGQTGSNVAPGVYVAVAAVIVLPIVIFGVPETYRQPLGQEADSRKKATIA